MRYRYDSMNKYARILIFIQSFLTNTEIHSFCTLYETYTHTYLQTEGNLCTETCDFDYYYKRYQSNL